MVTATWRANMRPEIEFLILANHAEAVNGLLYLTGGGWTDHRRPVRIGAPIPSSHMGIAVGIKAPWIRNDRTVTLDIDIESSDGSNVLAHVSGELHLAAPPEAPPGDEQHAVIAINAEVTFPEAGEYRIAARLTEGDETKYWPFRVHDMPVTTMPTQQSGNA